MKISAAVNNTNILLQLRCQNDVVYFRMISNRPLKQKQRFSAITAISLHCTIQKRFSPNNYGKAQPSGNDQTYCTLVSLYNLYIIKAKNISVLPDVIR